MWSIMIGFSLHSHLSPVIFNLYRFMSYLVGDSVISFGARSPSLIILWWRSLCWPSLHSLRFFLLNHVVRHYVSFGLQLHQHTSLPPHLGHYDISSLDGLGRLARLVSPQKVCLGCSSKQFCRGLPKITHHLSWCPFLLQGIPLVRCILKYELLCR